MWRPTVVTGEPCVEVLRRTAAPLRCNVDGHAQCRARTVGCGQPCLGPVVGRLPVALDNQQVTEYRCQRLPRRSYLWPGGPEVAHHDGSSPSDMAMRSP